MGHDGVLEGYPTQRSSISWSSCSRGNGGPSASTWPISGSGSGRATALDGLGFFGGRGRCKRAYVGMSARGNGGHYHYYACSGRQKLGRTACDGERLNRDQLEQAVIAQLLSLYRNGPLLQAAVAEATRRQHDGRPALEAQQRATQAEISKAERALDRYYEAFENGELAADQFADRVSALQERLHSLRDRAAELEVELAADERHGPDSGSLAAVADQLELVLAAGSPPKTKALLRLLIKELKVNGRSEILPTYRVLTPEVCATPGSVGAPGIEPGTSRV